MGSLFEENGKIMQAATHLIHWDRDCLLQAISYTPGSFARLSQLDCFCRPALIKILREKFAHFDLTYSIGGQISFDIFPKVPPKIKDCAQQKHCKCLSWRLFAWALHNINLAFAGVGQDLLPTICGEGFWCHPLFWRQNIPGEFIFVVLPTHITRLPLQSTWIWWNFVEFRTRFLLSSASSWRESRNSPCASKHWGVVRGLLSCQCVQGGNDHEIYESPQTQGHSVTTPIDTMTQCKKLFIDPAPVWCWPGKSRGAFHQAWPLANSQVPNGTEKA